jgi:predicted Zn-dependent peptidase
MNQLIKINNFTIIFNKTDSETTMVEAYVNNGAIYEDESNVGISHLLEHIVTEGWKKCKGPCSIYWSKRGVQTNASTGQTYVNYFMHGLKKYSSEMIEYIAGIAVKPLMTSKRLQKEKAAVEQELMMHKTNPELELYSELNKILFNISGLQYQDDLDLQLKLLKQFSLNDIRKWLNKFYMPGNMIFVVSGNISKELVKKTFNKKLKKYTEDSNIQHNLDIFQLGVKITYVKNTNMKNSKIILAFPSPLSQKDKEIHFIKLFEKLINSDTTSILFRQLREKQDLVYNITIEDSVHGYGSYILIKTQCENKDIIKVIRLCLEVLKNMSAGKLNKEKLKHIIELYLVEYYNTCKNNTNISSLLGEQYINQINNVENATIYTYKEITNILKNINIDEFITFIKKLLIFANLKIVYQGKQEYTNLLSLVLRKM